MWAAFATEESVALAPATVVRWKSSSTAGAIWPAVQLGAASWRATSNPIPLLDPVTRAAKANEVLRSRHHRRLGDGRNPCGDMTSSTY